MREVYLIPVPSEAILGHVPTSNLFYIFAYVYGLYMVSQLVD